MTVKMTAAQLHAMQAPKKGKKRVEGAQPTQVGDQKFHSKLEARRWQELGVLAACGQITDLRRQVPITLQGMNGPVLTPTGRPMRYIADFVYRDSKGAEVIEDAKGHPTEVFAIKRAILAAQGVTLRLIGKTDTGSGKWSENDYTALHRKIVAKEVRE